MWREMLPQLRAFVRRRIADPDRADDLVAEILLRIHQNVGSLDDQERLPNWVFRIARNAIIDEYRRAARSREHRRRPCRTRRRRWTRRSQAWFGNSRRACVPYSPDYRRATGGGGDDRSRRDEPGRRRGAPRGVAVRDEVPGAAWPSAPRRAARTVLRAHSRRSRSADGL